MKSTLAALVAAAVMLLACSDDIPSVSVEPRATEPDTVANLVANAEAFEYEIGGYGGSLTFATIAEPLTFNLALSNDAGSSGVLGYLFEGLTDISWLTGEPQPNLAHTWDVSEDGLTWTFYLRRDVRWHDGEPFTARDVEFTFNQIIYNEDIPTSTRAAFTFRLLDEAGEWQTAPMSVTAIDDYTIQCVLPVSYAPFLRSMTTAIYPQHILQPFVEDGTFNEVWDIGTDPSQIIGTGPFLIDQYVAGERVVFRRNPDYWLTDDGGNRLPYLDRIVQVIVPDLDSELEAFLSGLADVHGVLGHEFADLELLQEDENFTIHRRGPNFGSTFLAFNQNQGTDPESGEAYLSRRRSCTGLATWSFAGRWLTSSTRTRSSSRSSTGSAIPSGRRSVRLPATSTIPTSRRMSMTSTGPMRSSTNSAGPTATATASARMTAATRSHL